MLSQDTIDQFIIDTLLIDPITTIIDKLNKSEYRDCDIKWLDEKLYEYMVLSAKLAGLNVSVSRPLDDKKPTIMNQYAVDYYLRYFSKLLEFFKSF